MWSFANLLTFFRIFISPIFLVIYMEHDFFFISKTTLPYVLLFILLTSELSDAFDGFFARRYKQVSDFGKLFDPMADSIARISVFLTFTQPPIEIPLLLVFVFIYRDSVIGTLRTVCALRGRVLSARPTGKLKAILQGMVSITIVTLMIPASLDWITMAILQQASLALVSLVALYTVYSGVEYLIFHRDDLRSVVRVSTSKTFSNHQGT